MRLRSDPSVAQRSSPIMSKSQGILGWRETGPPLFSADSHQSPHSAPIMSLARTLRLADSMRPMVGMPLARLGMLMPLASSGAPFFRTASPFVPVDASQFGARLLSRLPENKAEGLSRLDPSSSVVPMNPLVYRSPLVDQPEPDDRQRAEANDLMSASSGAPLPTVIRRVMEQRIGMDLTSVRVHSGPGVMRAANLIAARSMAYGHDVFLPGGLPDSPTSPDMPLLAHELTHVAHHQGHRVAMTPPTPIATVRPLTLARRTSDQEQDAELIERHVSNDIREFRRMPTPELAPRQELTLSRPVAQHVQREGDVSASTGSLTSTATASVSIPPTATPDAAAPASPSAAELADQVYHLLERRLVVERERAGFRR